MDKGYRNYMIAPVVTLLTFSAVGLSSWLVEGKLPLLITYLYIGGFTATAMTLYAMLPKKYKRLGRSLSFVAVGLMLFLGMGVMGRENAQLEGFFFYLFTGITAGTVSHYLVAKILGPLILQRSWCGWACWTMLILNYLPYKKSEGWVPGKLRWLRYAHFALSMGLVMLLWFGFGYTIQRQNWDIRGMYWFLAGNGIYYSLGIWLALALKDNRAFCKYLCPITTFMKFTSIFSILRIKGEKSLCNDCGACTRICPFNIQVPQYTHSERRVLSTECIMCMKCINACPNDALSASLGFDLGGQDLLKEIS